MGSITKILHTSFDTSKIIIDKWKFYYNFNKFNKPKMKNEKNKNRRR